MEVGGTGEVRRNGKIASPGKPAKGAGLRPEVKAKADRLALSRQAVAFLEARSRRLMAEERKADASGGGKPDLLEKGLKTLNKCQKIYARVANGDKVPPEDLRYLEKNDPEGYKLALAMRRPKPRPKEWESVLDDEDRAGLDSGSDTPDAAAGT